MSIWWADGLTSLRTANRRLMLPSRRIHEHLTAPKWIAGSGGSNYRGPGC